jgi:hypothetical protein|nr:MAG TPA: hypothetical protein [Caudoviricetes sp.]
MSEGGVSRYIKTSVGIYFPEGHMACNLCPLLETYSRNQCRRTGEYLMDTRIIGAHCPLEIIEEEEEF